MRISKIILYDEPTVPEIKLSRLKKSLSGLVPIKIETRKNLFSDLDDEMYEKITSTKIFDIKKPFQKQSVFPNNTLIEKENTDGFQKEEIPLYDGIEFQKIISEVIPENENRIDILNIVFTNKLTCTFDESDFRYHGRSLIASNPAIISTTGMIEAPAKPKEYYLELITDCSEEKVNEINKKYRGQFLEYHDSRLSEVAEGHILQAIMYYETGDEFCNNIGCRCFNAHWQKDLFHSQIDNKKFCNNHQEILNQFKQK